MDIFKSKSFGVNKLYCIIYDYKKITKILLLYNKHINLLHDNFIITSIKKTDYHAILENIIVDINKEYNMISNNWIPKENKICYDDISNNNFKVIYNSYKNCRIIDADNHHNLFGNTSHFFFKCRDHIINNLAQHIGFPSLKILIYLLYGGSYKQICSEKNGQIDENITYHIEYLNNIFVPLEYKISQKIKKKNYFNIKNISKHYGYNIYNNSQIQLQLYNNDIIISGYFINTLTKIILKTSQISNNDIFCKYKEKRDFIYNKINKTFEKKYIKCSNIADILALSTEEFYNQIKHEYEQYDKIINSPFINIIRDFKENIILIKNNENIDKIKKICDILKYLLLGSQENINTAALLYDIAMNYKIDGIILTNIIDYNLDYTLICNIKKYTKHTDQLSDMNNMDIDFKKRLVTNSPFMPSYVKQLVLIKIDEMKNNNSDYYKQLIYVDSLINFPWVLDDSNIVVNQTEQEYLNNIDTRMNNLIYGHIKSKDCIKEILGKWISNPLNNGNVIGLVGPPGTGKTLFAKAISQSLNIPFIQITLGGQNDGDILHGHNYTSSGAQPGIIIKKMCEMGKARCIIYFDELDKACKKHDSNEIYNILINMIDPQTNSNFHDRFFHEITFPLNKVLFIFSYNDSSLIDKILLDRINEIQIFPYNNLDKINITKKFLLKEMNTMIGNNKNITISDKNIEYIIDGYTNEPGIRELKHKLEKIFMKINLEKIYGGNEYVDIIEITKDIIIKYLGLSSAQIVTNNVPILNM